MTTLTIKPRADRDTADTQYARRRHGRPMTPREYRLNRLIARLPQPVVVYVSRNARGEYTGIEVKDWFE